MPDSTTSYTDHDTKKENSRRDFLKQLALMGIFSGISPLLPSCSNAIEANGKAEDVFGVWEEMLQAIQQSPDYLPKRIENLIAGKDPEAMFNFVRDEINLVPPSASSLRGIGTFMRYGLNGVLRDGFATPREKAELLNQMFQQAGITSKVVFERTDFKTEEVPSLFFRPVERKAEPVISDAQYKNWERVLNSNTPKQTLSFVDESGQLSRDLADKLWELLPEKEKIRYQSFDFRWDNYRTPAVAFEWEGETKYAHLFDPTVPFGQLRNANQLAEAGEATYSGDKVQLKVTFREGIEPRKEHLLVEKDWPVEQLIGKQLQLSFFHGLNLKEQAQTNIGSLRTFTPALTYQSFEHTWEEMEQRSVFGNPITLEGRVI
ncbi:MAG: twin-arginine translocation signal domain-containing protein, partial [Cyclobacteriaceae bacterium]|nr:twin-arginine translocation signal domain-containing protein [Cyclobacteriaceae bacterium]